MSRFVALVLLLACGEAKIPPAPPTVRESHVEPVAPTPTCAPRDDRDGDGIADACDRCPDEGKPDGGGIIDPTGCPRPSLVIIRESVQRIIQQIHFARNSDVPLPESNAVFDAIERVMKDNPDLDLVGFVGHATRDEANPTVLADKRAASVCAELRRRGIAPWRLQPHGAGAKWPLVIGNDPRNRRVEPHLVTRSGVTLAAWNIDRYDSVDLPPEPPKDPACPSGVIGRLPLCPP